METVKTGFKWAVKAYLYLLLAMVVVLCIAGFLSDPFGALTGAGAEGP